MIFLLTATGLTPGGSSTVHIYTNNTQNNTLNKNNLIYNRIGKSAGRAPSLREPVLLGVFDGRIFTIT